jgi:cysteine desulfurase/selenocysteine lyase
MEQLTTSAEPTLDAARLRQQFPALLQQVHGRPLVYLDNGATTQKPRVVIEAVERYYREDNANVHRGVHLLSERATAAYEGAREAVRRFLNAASVAEIVFTRNATEAINLVARAWGDARVGPGDEVVITTLEHHSNIVPWQQLCARRGATLRAVPIDDDGNLENGAFTALIGPRTRLAAFTHVSNALGTVNPVGQMVAAAREAGAAVLVDGSQAVAHMPVDVQAIGADFYVFTGHKLFGPTGIGVLYGREDVLDATPPFLGGGDMIRTVTLHESTWNDLPYKFEAGTPHIAGAVGLGAAVQFLEALDFGAVRRHEETVLAHAVRVLEQIDGLQLVGRPRQRAGVVSFLMEGIHPHDIGTIVDAEGVAIRTGHHCAQPVMDRYGIAATARASFSVYNTLDDVEALAAALTRVRKVMG